MTLKYDWFENVMRLTCYFLGLVTVVLGSIASSAEKPNVVIIFLDDSGYADFRPFGSPPYPTPHVEELAQQGIQLTQFYVPTAVCSSSRSSLLSGCYAGRHRMFGAHGPGGRGLCLAQAEESPDSIGCDAG